MKKYDSNILIASDLGGNLSLHDLNTNKTIRTIHLGDLYYTCIDVIYPNIIIASNSD